MELEVVEIQRKLLVLVFVALLGGLGGLSLIKGYNIYQAQISELQKSISELRNDYDRLETAYEVAYEQIESLIDNPRFALTGVYFFITNVSYQTWTTFPYKDTAHTLNGTLFVTILNIGNEDAHNLTVHSEMDLYPLPYPPDGNIVTPVWCGDATLGLLPSKGLAEIPIPMNQTWFSNIMRTRFVYLRVAFNDGIIQEFTFEYDFLHY